MNKITAKKVLILGYGKEGKSTLSFFQKHYPDIQIAVSDQSLLNKSDLTVPSHTGPNYLDRLFDYDLVIKSPGIPSDSSKLIEYVQKGGRVTSQISIFFENAKGTLVGITGSKGKSTTAALTHSILKKKYEDVRLGANIGTPALDLLEGADEGTIFVLELSSQQLESVEKSPHIAVFLNFYPGHLDHHKTTDNYLAAKLNIISHQTADDYLIYNPSNTDILSSVAKAKSQKFTFSLGDFEYLNAYVEKDEIHTFFMGQDLAIVPTADLKLIGQGNVENVMAAAIVGQILKVPAPLIQEAVSAFQPLPHRLENIGEVKNIRFYNDSLASVPEATIHTVKTLGDDLETVIVGGFDRGNVDYALLADTLIKSKVKTLILLPTTGDKIRLAMHSADKNSDIEFVEADSMKRAVKIAFEKTDPGKICALSPASPSFGLFKDYADRGDQFKKYVSESKTTS